MIAPLLLAAAAIADLPGGDPARFEACVALTRSSPEQAIAEANAGARKSKGVPAQQCLGLAFAAGEQWTAAAVAFDEAARSAQTQGDGRAAALWVQAGNAALAGEDPVQARAYLDRALALPTMGDVMRGEAWLDRARTDVALNDLPLARKDLDNGMKLAAADPFAWLLSATLARRQNDLPRATKDIEQAEKLAPDDPSVVLEIGNIASVSGAPGAATAAWKRVVTLAPDEPEGKAAAQSLASGLPPALDYSLEEKSKP